MDVFRETRDLRRLLFSKQKHPVPSDLWIPGAAPQGQEQFVCAVVSEKYVLRKLMDVMVKREAWLTQENLPMNCQMRDGKGLERARFMKHIKTASHSEPHQLDLQWRDEQISKKRFKDGMHSRWGCEMQRRLGSKVMWEIVSFSGRFSVDFLTKVNSVDAPQPDVTEPDSQRKLTAKAVQCRGTLRWAHHLDRKRKRGDRDLSDQDMTLLDDFDTGKLRKQANNATTASGHGRIRFADGGYVDIGAEVGGAARRLRECVHPITKSTLESK